MKWKYWGIYFLIILFLLLIPGCCTRKTTIKKQPKSRKSASYLSNMYDKKEFDIDWMLDEENVFINRKEWKAKFAYLYSNQKTYQDPEIQELRQKKDIKDALELFKKGDYEKSYNLMKKNYTKLSSNKYMKKLLKKVEMAYLHKKAFYDKSVEKASFYLINEDFSSAQRELRKLREKAKKNLFLQREYYKLGAALFTMKKNKIYAHKFYEGFRKVSKAIKKKYGL